MLDRSDIIWFTDPNPSYAVPGPKSRNILVSQMRIMRPAMMGQILQCDMKTFSYEGVQGWFTIDGAYANGSLSGTAMRGQVCLWVDSVESDSDWGIGSIGRLLGGDNHDSHAIIDSPRRASGRQLSGNDRHVVQRKLTFRPADWALELFPVREDSEEEVAKKVALAKARWVNLYARWKLSVEGESRGWSVHLDEIRDEAHFGHLSYKAHVTGSATFAQGRSSLLALSEPAREALSKIPGGGESARVNVSMPYNFTIPDTFTTKADALSVRNVASHAQVALNDYSIGYALDRIEAVPSGITRHHLSP